MCLRVELKLLICEKINIEFNQIGLDFLSIVWYCWCYQRTGGNAMILQALKLNKKDDSKPSRVGDESSFAIKEVYDEGNN